MKANSFFLVAVLFTGCASTSDWSATSLSQAEDLIRVSQASTDRKDFSFNERKADSFAVWRCKTLGYHAAEASGEVAYTSGSDKSPNTSGALQMSQDYRCIGNARQVARLNIGITDDVPLRQR